MEYLFLFMSISLQCLNFGSGTAAVVHAGNGDGVQPLSKIAIHKAVYALHENASVKAHPLVLGTKVKSSSVFIVLLSAIFNLIQI